MWNVLFWKQTTTLYIDDTSIRLLTTQRQKVKKWAEMKLDPGLIKDSIVNQESEVALRIKTLLKTHEVNQKRIVLGCSGLRCLTRPATLPQLPPNMLREAVAREARRVLPVPIDQLYLAWRQVPCPRGRIQVFIAAIPRKIADSLIKTVQMAGLEPQRMSIKPLSLTKALPENSAIMVDLQQNEFDVVVMIDGISQPVRTVALPSEQIAWEQKLGVVASDLERTIKFYDTNNPDRPLDANLPVYVSGEFLNTSETEKTEALKNLSNMFGRPVKFLTPYFKGIEQVDLVRYGANVAMIISAQDPSRELTFPVADINMLPAPYQPKPVSMTKLVGIPSGVAVAGLLVPLIMTMQGNNANISAMQNQLDNARQMLTEKTKQKTALTTQINDLKKQTTAAQTTAQNLSLALKGIQAQQEYVNGDIQVTLGKLPGDITISRVSENNQQLIITGSAPTDTDIQAYAQTILNYARALDMSDRFAQSTVSSIIVTDSDGKNGAGAHIDFTLTFIREG